MNDINALSSNSLHGYIADMNRRKTVSGSMKQADSSSGFTKALDDRLDNVPSQDVTIKQANSQQLTTDEKIAFSSMFHSLGFENYELLARGPELTSREKIAFSNMFDEIGFKNYNLLASVHARAAQTG